MSTNEASEQPEPAGAAGFVPKGAIAFLVVMVIVYAAVWLLFYSILVGRS